MASEPLEGPLVLRAREVETVEGRGPRSPSPIFVHERERSRSPPPITMERRPRFLERERSPEPERYYERDYYDRAEERAGPLVPREKSRRDDDDEVTDRRLVRGRGRGRSSSSYADQRALNRSRSRERSSRSRYFSPSRSRRSYYDDEDFYSPPPRRTTPPQEQPQQPLFNPPPPAQIVINNYHHGADFSGDGSSDDTDTGSSGRRRRHQRNRKNGKRDRVNDVKLARQSRDVSDAPVSVSEQVTSGGKVATDDQGNSGAQAVLSRKGVNAIWDPSQNSDITVHLKLPLREEGLDEQIEEFCRLRRLGDFASAKRFFGENLVDHHDNPYFLVQYAEMLLEQGDYITLTELNGHAAFAPDNHLLGGREGALLRVYWKLLQLVRSLDCPPTDWTAVSIIPEALTTLHDTVASGEGPVGSTEIKLLAVILGLAGIKDNVYLQTQWLRRQLARFVPEAFYRRLYTDLLRDGRVWDFHDIFISKVWADGVKEAIQSFAGPITDSQKPLTALLDDWKSPVGENDGSTALAMLDMLLSVSPVSTSDRNRIYDIEEDTMALATQTATSVMKSNPELMDSQPFLYWMLRKSGSALLQNGNQQSLFYEHLQSQPGISASFRFNPIPGIYHHRGFGLPEYTPAETENPGWRQDEAPAEYQAPAKLVLKQAKRFENYRMQSQALTNLILFSKSPTKLFDELCTLQRSVQGDIKRYAHTLGSTYLALDADTPTDDLRHAIREVFYEPESCLTTHEKWYQGLLLYSLETDPAERENVLDLAFDNSRYMSKEALALLDVKMPEIRRKRMEYLETHIKSETERRQAEKGICSSLRLREAMELPEFPELEMEEQPEEDKKKPSREEATKHDTDETQKPQDDAPARDPVREIKDNEYDSDTSQQIRRERSRRRRHRRERERSEERRIARERDHEMDLKLQRFRHELDVAKIRQETNIVREKRLSEDRSRQEMEALRKELGELQRRHDRDELEEHHKLEEQLKQSQAKVEEMRREEQELARRERLERDAVERYKRESAERRSHEDLMRELREVRTEMAEVKSAVKPQPQGTYLPEHGGLPLGPIRLPDYPVWRRKHLRVPPRVIKVNYVPSSSSSSDSSSDGEDADFRDAHPTGGESRDKPPDRAVREANYHRSVEELDDSDTEPTYPDDIDLEAGRVDPGQEKLGG